MREVGEVEVKEDEVDASPFSPLSLIPFHEDEIEDSVPASPEIWEASVHTNSLVLVSSSKFR